MGVVVLGVECCVIVWWVLFVCCIAGVVVKWFVLCWCGWLCVFKVVRAVVLGVYILLYCYLVLVWVVV